MAGLSGYLAGLSGYLAGLSGYLAGLSGYVAVHVHVTCCMAVHMDVTLTVLMLVWLTCCSLYDCMDAIWSLCL